MSGWKIYTALYLAWCTTWMIWDYLRGSYVTGTIMLGFFILASYWFFRIWIQGKKSIL